MNTSTTLNIGTLVVGSNTSRAQSVVVNGAINSKKIIIDADEVSIYNGGTISVSHAESAGLGIREIRSYMQGSNTFRVAFGASHGGAGGYFNTDSTYGYDSVATPSLPGSAGLHARTSTGIS